MSEENQLQLLSKLFGSYKAEWLQDSLFELFSEPSYFPELTTSRPCVLIGGRGTGKTTVLKSLSYAGQWELQRRRLNGKEETLPALAREASHYGFYYRANTPRLSAFKGEALSKEEWQKLFTHYINVLFTIQLVHFFKWYKENVISAFDITPSLIKEICSITAIEECHELDALIKLLNGALISMETYINNIGIDECPRLSSPGALDSIFTLAADLSEFKNKTFFLIIDEYENFRDEQQEVVNTLIKHTSSSYTFKIGVRKLGWRVKRTLNENEVLTSPADYVLIDIAEKLDDVEFSNFAEEICNSRIAKLLEKQQDLKFTTVQQLFPNLPLAQEAELLGLKERAADLRISLEHLSDKRLLSFSKKLSDLELYIIYYCSTNDTAFIRNLEEASLNPGKWEYKYNEYGYASLFLLNKSSRKVKKYYAGWGVFCHLSAINIRYLLELVEQTLLLHIKSGGIVGTSEISPGIQTEAAQAVGKKNLQELDGLSIYGAKLTKLVLGLGRIFGNLAESSAGHAHEVNQFRLRQKRSSEQPGTEAWLISKENTSAKIVNAAVMHMALIPFPGNKPKDLGDTKESTFQLHPIFAPYFSFSHRKRRNLMLDEDDIIGLIETPKDTINKVLSENNRDLDKDLPEQLKLFSAYYE